MDNILKQEELIECKISIIIPCYNSGLFLPDALSSIEQMQYSGNYEVIIVNDGSTDKHTVDLLQQLNQSSYVIINQKNLGPASARNSGVKRAKGNYILFLDSDNKVGPDYINQAVPILDSNPEIGVVHGDASFFGESTAPRFYGTGFSMASILERNQIDMCSVVRKEAWASVGGLDESRVLIGHEDWDFWIRLGAEGWRFYHIPDVMFAYRVRNDSLVKVATQPAKYQEMLRYIYGKHIGLMLSTHSNHELLLSSYRDILEQHNYYQYDKKHPFRSFLKYFYAKYFSK